MFVYVISIRPLNPLIDKTIPNLDTDVPKPKPEVFFQVTHTQIINTLRINAHTNKIYAPNIKTKLRNVPHTNGNLYSHMNVFKSANKDSRIRLLSLVHTLRNLCLSQAGLMPRRKYSR